MVESLHFHNSILIPLSLVYFWICNDNLLMDILVAIWMHVDASLFSEGHFDLARCSELAAQLLKFIIFHLK